MDFVIIKIYNKAMREYKNIDGQIETAEYLKEKYNPEGSPLRRVQIETLEMLKWLDKICKENNLEWFLSSGNLLGIVRHDGGYVPWDDDIDIYMMEKECKKLEKILMSGKYKNENFVLQNHKTDKGYYTFWPVIRYTKSEFIENVRIHNARKYRGCQIDIFPISEKRLKGFAHFIVRFEKLNKILFIGRKGLHIFASILYYFEKIILIPIYKLLSNIFCKKGKLYHANPNVFYKTEFYKTDIYPLKTAKFEGYEVPVPNNIDGYLKSVYGDDYMTLVSPNKRQDHRVIEYKFFD